MHDFTLADFQALREEDGTAYKKLFQLTYKSIIQTLVKNGASLEDAQNCFQDALLKFVYQIRAGKVQYQSPSKLKGFVYKITWHLFLLLQKERNKTKETEVSIEAANHLIEQEEQNKRINQQTLAWKALGETPQPCQGILKDTIVKGIKAKYLLEKYGYKNANSFKDRKSRCLKQLRKRLNKLLSKHQQ